ncbi:Purine permease [Thalictrum thalictroides]|uniref:Purine permease n=1 Tax=Thalictrum thalictroides TaxID=46969 RepID=A0A7J6V5U6_THATH|nr:Purine permease [Thalictrum thalictroides]
MFGLGLSYLPASTSSLLMSTQLAFTAVFSLLLVRQKFTSYSINSVVLMTLGSVILAFHTNGDKPHGVSKGEYFLGFFITLGAAALLGFMLPLIELTYSKACKVITYDLVLQLQFVVSMVATLLCTVAMVINKDFQAMTREAREYGLGERKYYIVITFAAFAMQCLLVGNLGVVFCSTALFSGVLLALLLPIQQIFAVIFFHEKFSAEKGISLALSLWGFVSYFYGEYKFIKKQKQASLMAQLHSTTGP